MKLLLLLLIAPARLAVAAPVPIPPVLARSDTAPLLSPLPKGDILRPHRRPFTVPTPAVPVVSRLFFLEPSETPLPQSLSKRHGLINDAGCEGWSYDGDNPVCSPTTGPKAMTPEMRLATLVREITARIHPDYAEQFSHPEFQAWEDNDNGKGATTATAKEKRQDAASVGPFPYPEDDPECHQDRAPTPFTCDMTHDEMERMNEKLGQTEGYDAKVAIMDEASGKVMKGNKDLFAEMWKELAEEVHEGVRMCKEDGYTVDAAVDELEAHQGEATKEWIARAEEAKQDPDVAWAEEHSGEAPSDFSDPGSGAW